MWLRWFRRSVAALLVPLVSIGPLADQAWSFPTAAPLNFRIPASLGNITDRFIPSGKSTQPTLVLIQDLHGNAGVQRRIAEIIKRLAREQGLRTIFSEGAKGPFDVSLIRSIANAHARAEVVQRCLADSLLAGDEMAAIENPQPLHLWGIDDRDLYIRNLRAFYLASRTKPVPLPELPVWQKYFEIAKQRNTPLAQNTIAHIALLNKTAAPPRMAALVAGGFHTPGITQILRAHQIPYAVVTPSVESVGEDRALTTHLRELAELERVDKMPAPRWLAISSFLVAGQQAATRHMAGALAAVTIGMAPSFFARIPFGEWNFASAGTSFFQGLKSVHRWHHFSHGLLAPVFSGRPAAPKLSAEETDQRRTQALLGQFHNQFVDEPDVVIKASGRNTVSLDHTDYPKLPQDGTANSYTIAMASEKNTLFASKKRTDGLVKLFAANFNQSFEFDVQDLDAMHELAKLGRLTTWKGQVVPGWAKNALALFYSARQGNAGVRKGLPIGGGEFVFEGNIPLGAGQSSSASYLVGLTLSLKELYQWNTEDIYVLADVARSGEHEDYSSFVKGKCGFLDQITILAAKKGKLILINHGNYHDIQSVNLDFDALGYHYIPIPSGFSRELSKTAYGDRVDELSRVPALMNELLGQNTGKSNVHQFTVTEWDSIKVRFQERDPVLFGRANYQFEGLRAKEQFVEAAAAGDIEAIARLMNWEAEALSNDGEFPISGYVPTKRWLFFNKNLPVVDTARKAARAAGATAARMIGGGGASPIGALVKSELFDSGDFQRQFTDHYYRATGKSPPIASDPPSDGVQVLWRKPVGLSALGASTLPIETYRSADGFEVARLTDTHTGTVVEILPERATVRGMWVRIGQEMKPVLFNPEGGNPSENGAVPYLGPWINRIADAKLNFDGHSLDLQKVPGLRQDGQGHALHGLMTKGWRRLGSGVDVNGIFMTAEIDSSVYAPPTTEAGQIFGPATTQLTWRLQGNELRLESAVINRTPESGPESHPIPDASGWHPWLRVGDRTRVKVTIPASRRRLTWNMIPLPIPALPIPWFSKHNFRRGRLLKNNSYDNNYTDLVRGPDGFAMTNVEDPTRGLSIDVGIGPDHEAVMYAPSNQPFVCLEPSAAINALGNKSPRGYRVISILPGATHRSTTFIRVSIPRPALDPIARQDYDRERLLSIVRDWRSFAGDDREVRLRELQKIALEILGVQQMSDYRPLRPTFALIAAAGEGSRMKGFFDQAKQLFPVQGEPILFYIMSLVEPFLSPALPPVIIVHPGDYREVSPGQWLPTNSSPLHRGTYGDIHDALVKAGRSAILTSQSPPLRGDGDAVKKALTRIAQIQSESDPQVLIIWGDMAMTNGETILTMMLVADAARALRLDVPFIVGTRLREKPYAPIIRDGQGYVMGSDKGGVQLDLGEDDTGVFLGGFNDIKNALLRFPRTLAKSSDDEIQYINPLTGKIPKKGELNLVQITNLFYKLGRLPLALPISRLEESIGVNDPSEAENVELLRNEKDARFAEMLALAPDVPSIANLLVTVAITTPIALQTVHRVQYLGGQLQDLRTRLQRFGNGARRRQFDDALKLLPSLLGSSGDSTRHRSGRTWRFWLSRMLERFQAWWTHSHFLTHRGPESLKPTPPSRPAALSFAA